MGACGGATAADLPWWNERVFYEVFVRSFQDSDGDGIGDIQGLISRLDYLNDGDPSTTDDLGITGIWLMPMAESPSYHGYDVVDYEQVEQDYGTADDFKQLVAAAHERGIAIIADLVLNHTSAEHPWFVDAQVPGSVHDSWYEWSDTDPGTVSPAGNPVWYRAGSRFYYSYFWQGMADLNLANPEVTAALDEVARYWVEELGVDGFRLDAIKHLFERGDVLEELPESHVWLAGFKDRLTRVEPDLLTVGEVFSDTKLSAAWVPESVDLTFDFGFADAVVGGLFGGGTGDAAAALRASLADYPPAQRAVFLTNHDQTRTITRLGGDPAAAKAAAAVLLTQPGVPFVYYGEEVGLTGDKPDERIRTPMPWAPTPPGLGFSSVAPWESPEDGFAVTNVATESADPASILSTYRDLIRLRATHPALRGAETVVLDTSSPALLATLRHADAETLLVITNFGIKQDAASVDLSTAGCVTAGAPAQALYGADTVAPPDDLAAYVPVPELAAYQTLIIRLGG